MKKKSGILIFVFCCFLFPASMLAQESRSTIKGKSSGTDSLPRKSYAIILGVSKYQHMTNLSFATEDAIAIKNFLRSLAGGALPDSNIYMLLDSAVTSGQLEMGIWLWLNAKPLSKGERVYFYFAGHGEAFFNNYYLFTSNAAADKPKNYWIRGNIPVAFIHNTLLYHVKAKGADAFFISDACRSLEPKDTLTKNNMPVTANIQGNPDDKGLYSLFATKGGGLAFEDHAYGGGHGLFTYHFLQGAAGMADKKAGNADGIVSLRELSRYVEIAVEYATASKGTPQFPMYCCPSDDQRPLFKIDTNVYKAALNNEYFTARLTDDNFIIHDAAARNPVPERQDVIQLYNKCIAGLKSSDLISSDQSSYALLRKLQEAWPESVLTKKAALTVTVALVNYTKTVIDLYLSGEDMSYVEDKSKTADLDAGVYQNFIRISAADFTLAAAHLEKALYLANRCGIENKHLTARLYFLQARSYFDKQSKLTLASALLLAKQALSIDTSGSHILHLLAMLETKNGNIHAAELYFIKAMEGEKNALKTGLELGYHFFKLRKFNEASVYYRLQHPTKRQFAIACNSVALAYLQNNQWQTAEKFLKLGLSRDSTATFLRNNLASLYFEQAVLAHESKRPLQAEYYYTTALSAVPSSVSLLVNIGNFYHQQKQHATAHQFYFRAKKIDPDNTLILSNIATLFYNNRVYDSAISYSQKILSIDDSTSFNYRSAVVRIKNSIQHLQKRHGSPTPLQDLHNPDLNVDTTGKPEDVAKKYFYIREYQKAIQLLRKALSSDVKNMNFMLLLADAYIEAGDPVEARKVLSSLEKHASTVNLFIQTAQRYSKLDDLSGSKRLLAKATQADQYSAEAVLLLGEVYEKENNLYSAEAIYQSSHYRMPAEKRIIERLYEFYLLTGNRQNAERFLLKLSQMAK